MKKSALALVVIAACGFLVWLYPFPADTDAGVRDSTKLPTTSPQTLEEAGRTAEAEADENAARVAPASPPVQGFQGFQGTQPPYADASWSGFSRVSWSLVKRLAHRPAEVSASALYRHPEVNPHDLVIIKGLRSELMELCQLHRTALSDLTKNLHDVARTELNALLESGNLSEATVHGPVGQFQSGVSVQKASVGRITNGRAYVVPYTSLPLGSVAFQELARKTLEYASTIAAWFHHHGYASAEDAYRLVDGVWRQLKVAGGGV